MTIQSIFQNPVTFFICPVSYVFLMSSKLIDARVDLDLGFPVYCFFWVRILIQLHNTHLETQYTKWQAVSFLVMYRFYISNSSLSGFPVIGLFQ